MKITPRATPVLLAIILLLHDCTRTAYTKSSLRVRAVDNDNDFLIAVNVTDCDRVKPFFDSKNISLVPAKDLSKTICGGKCCDEEMEKQLKQQARADFHNLIHHHSRTLQGLLITTADFLRGSVAELARQSQNTTLIMFHKAYSSMEESSEPFVKALYKSIVNYVSPANTPDNLQQPLSREMLQENILEFFTRLFSIAYLKLINPQQQQEDQEELTNKFKVCLHESMVDIQPFGDIPQETSLAVSKSLEATRVLVQALILGKTVLEKTDGILFSPDIHSLQQEACNAAIFRMTYCPKCKGLANAIMPCNAFCINVIRGCLTEPASELDLAWSGYVETIERLIVAVDGHNDPLGLNTVNAVKQLGTRISDAILRSLENGPKIVKKVRSVCGRSKLLASSKEKTSSDAAAVAKLTTFPGSKAHAAASFYDGNLAHQADDIAPTKGKSQDQKLYVHLGNFLASMVRSRIFYGTLADSICEDYPEKHCWNGERVGEYSKTVVDSSQTAQRYNPEFTITAMSSKKTSYDNTNIRSFIDQLRHINQMVQSQLASSPDAGAFLGDEALDGSGSGDGPYWRPRANGGLDDDEDGDNHDDDDDDDDDDSEGSGSGMGPTTTDTSVKIHQSGSAGSGSSTILLSFGAFVVVCASLIA